MIQFEDCEFVQMRSFDDEPAFFAQMGQFFASATVRRDCGGYPLSDGLRHRWFIVRYKDQSRVLGFVSIEHRTNAVRIRDGYLRPEARKRGLFRALRQQVLNYIDDLGQSCTARVLEPCAEHLVAHGFAIQSTRGNWVTLTRPAHVASSQSDESGQGPLSRTRRSAARAAHRSAEPDPQAPA